MPDRHQTIGLYRVKMTGSSRRIHWTCSWRRLVLYLLDSRRKTRDPGDRRYYPGVRRGWNARGYSRTPCFLKKLSVNPPCTIIPRAIYTIPRVTDPAAVWGAYIINCAFQCNASTQNSRRREKGLNYIVT